MADFLGNVDLVEPDAEARRQSPLRLFRRNRRDHVQNVAAVTKALWNLTSIETF
ncbi:hypothetical protein V8J62_05205 [Phyllobacterium sp. CCNWLW11]